MALVAAGASALAPARAEDALVVRDVRLQEPTDSHEPQRATLTLRNTGAGPAAAVSVLCTFTGAAGAVLGIRTVTLADIPGGGATRAEAVACRVGNPGP